MAQRRSPYHVVPFSPTASAVDEVETRVTRNWLLARTSEGGVALRVGRRKDTGPPRRSPCLHFDELTPSP
jgi:hypothetical protein